jgi:predicted rRNA methylase YqxC with S4 and FtsJ domains
MRLSELIVHRGLANSIGEANRKIKEGAVSVDGRKVMDWEAVIDSPEGAEVRVGRKVSSFDGDEIAVVGIRGIGS